MTEHIDLPAIASRAAALRCPTLGDAKQTAWAAFRPQERPGMARIFVRVAAWERARRGV